MINPLRIDPTRTGMQRRKNEARIKRKFSSVKRRVAGLIIGEDALGLSADSRSSTKVMRNEADPTINTRWRFNTDSQKVQEFERWIRGQLGEEFLGASEDRVWQAYIQDGYRRGAGRAFDDVNKAKRFAPWEGGFYQGSKNEFLRSMFAHPISQDRVKMLVGRTLTDLNGVTEATATSMSRTLADGLVRGLSSREVARELSKGLDMGLKRALTISRTELIRAHAEGQLTGLEDLGVEEVGVAVEWVIAGNACELCNALAGVVMKISEARGLIPRHPSCRCAWIPANVGENKKGQKRSKGDINKAVSESVKLETGEDTVKQARQDSRWVGADVDPSKDRPTSVLNVGDWYQYPDTSEAWYQMFKDALGV